MFYELTLDGMSDVGWAVRVLVFLHHLRRSHVNVRT